MRLVNSISTVLCCVACLCAAPVEAQLPLDATAVERESDSDAQHDIRVRRLRIAGWTMLGIGVTAPFSFLAEAILSGPRSDEGFEQLFVFWSVVGTFAGVALVSASACLIAARIKVGRRRRFRAQQAALDRSYFHPELDIGVTPGGLSLHLSF